MSETRYTLDQDLKEAVAMADALATYVKGDQLYGSISGGWLAMQQMPSLTVGALLLRLRRLHALGDRLTPSQSQTLAAAQAKHDAVRRDWTQHYTQKLVHEVKSRLKSMDNYFEDMRDDPRGAVQSYLPEALRRTIAQEVRAALPEIEAAEQTAIDAAQRKADAGLRRWTQPDNFLWDKVLEGVYPQPTYWWLYVRPIQPNSRHSDG